MNKERIKYHAWHPHLGTGGAFLHIGITREDNKAYYYGGNPSELLGTAKLRKDGSIKHYTPNHTLYGG